MDKILKQNYKLILLFILYLASALAAAFFRELANTDELWNYTFGVNIAHGLLPYRDFNYLQTPLSAALNGLLLVLFGDHILVMRLAGAALFTAIGMQLYKSGRCLGMPALWASLPGFAAIVLFYTNIFFEYSDSILFLLLFMMGIDLKAAAGQAGSAVPAVPDTESAVLNGSDGGAVPHTESAGFELSRYTRRWLRPSFQLAVGLAGGAAILNKQSYGLFTAAASWVSVFAICRLIGRGRKETLKLTFFRMLGSAIPCAVFLLYLICSGTFGDFLDMCVFGIGSFNSYYRYTALMAEYPGYFIAGVAMPAGLAVGALFSALRLRPSVKDPRKRRSGLQMLVILLYSLFGMINMVPLSNLFHFEICSVPVMLVAELLLVEFFPWINRRFMRLLAYAAAASSLIFLLGSNPYTIVTTLGFHTDIADYEGTFISDKTAGEIRQVDEFIERERALGHEVYVVDNMAAFYFNPLNIYHKYLDMFLTGNLGTRTPSLCLEESELPNAVYLFPDETRSNTQYPTGAVNEFKKMLISDGTLGSFQVYRTISTGQ